MPFVPLLPAPNSPITSAELRNQFTGLKDLIDAVPPPQIPASVALDGIVRLDTTPAIDVLNSRLIASNGTFIAADWSSGSLGLGFLHSLAPATEIGLQCDLNFGGNHIYGDTGNNDRSLCINPGARLLVAPDGVTVVATWADGTLKTGNGTPFSTGATVPPFPVTGSAVRRRRWPKRWTGWRRR